MAKAVHCVCDFSYSHAVVLQVSNEASTLLAEMTDFDAVATGDNLDDLSTNVAAVSCLSHYHTP